MKESLGMLLESFGVRDTTTPVWPISRMSYAVLDVLGILEVFLHDLLQESIDAELPATDIEAIKAIEEDSVVFPARFSAEWVADKPSWSKPSPILNSLIELEQKLEFEDFDSIIRASSSFRQLRWAVSRYIASSEMAIWTRTYRTMAKPPTPTYHLGVARIWFECVSWTRPCADVGPMDLIKL
jgi:hypothetical protein